jgi:hypothetical protein
LLNGIPTIEQLQAEKFPEPDRPGSCDRHEIAPGPSVPQRNQPAPILRGKWLDRKNPAKYKSYHHKLPSH